MVLKGESKTFMKEGNFKKFLLPGKSSEASTAQFNKLNREQPEVIDLREEDLLVRNASDTPPVQARVSCGFVFVNQHNAVVTAA